MTTNNRKKGILALTALMVSCLVAHAVTINTYNNWTTVPNNTTGDVALNKTVTLCDGTLAGGTVSRFTDGTWQTGNDDTARSVWGGWGAGQNFRASIDLTQSYSVSEIDTWSWHSTSIRAPQEYYVWGAASPSATGTSLTFASYAFGGTGLTAAGYTLIGHVVTNSTWSEKVTSQLSSIGGNYRYLVFDIAPSPEGNHGGTFYGEIAVKAALPSTKDMLTFSFPSLGAATISSTNITMTVPYGTNVTALSPTYTHNGASCSPASGSSQNFSSPVHYIVTAGDSSTQDYTVTVTVAPATKDMLTFTFPSLGAATINGTNIARIVPYGTDVTALAPTYTHNGASCSPASGSSRNFTSPAHYIVTAADSSTKDYLVTVIVLPNVTINSYNNWTTVPNNTTGDVALNKTVTLCDGTLAGSSQAVSALTNGLWQTSNDSPGSSVWGLDGPPTNYRVSIDLTQSYSISEIDAWSWHSSNLRGPQEYYVWGAASPSVTGTGLKFATYAFGAGLGSAGYTLLGHVTTGTASGQWTTQLSGSIGSYRYLVFDIAPDPVSPYLGTFYGELAVKGTLPSTKDMLTFTFPSLGAATITGTDITMTVPYGTDVTALSPTYTTNGASCSPASGSSHNFSSPVHYTVTAADSSTKDYTVTVTVTPASTAKNLLTFGLPGNPAAIDQVAKAVTWYVPFGTNLATLAPAYTVSQFATGSPATATAPNFATTNPATYTITAQNGDTQSYLVSVYVLPDLTINTYNNWTTVPNTTTDDVALGKTVTLCDGTLNVNGGSQAVSALTDGLWQTSNDNPGRSVFGSDFTNYRVSIDLAKSYSVSEIDAWSWHSGVRAPQEYYVWGAASPSATGTSLKFNTYAFGGGLASAGYTMLGHVATGTASGKWTTQLSGSIGTYRYLVFDIAPAPVSPNLASFFGEIAVKGTDLYGIWANGYNWSAFTNPDKSPAGNPDGDALTNLFEFAFGTDPTVSSSGPITYVLNGAVTGRGQPTTQVTNTGYGVDFRAVFGRRKDYVAAGLTYTVEFSAGLDVWVPSTDVPTVLATDGTIDAVSVPYPFFIPTAHGVEKPTFFRVGVNATSGPTQQP